MDSPIMCLSVHIVMSLIADGIGKTFSLDCLRCVFESFIFEEKKYWILMRSLSSHRDISMILELETFRLDLNKDNKCHLSLSRFLFCSTVVIVK